jgi:stage II sporulation protein D
VLEEEPPLLAEGGPEVIVHLTEASRLRLFLPGQVEITVEPAGRRLEGREPASLSRAPEAVDAWIDGSEIVLGDWRGEGPVKVRPGGSLPRCFLGYEAFGEGGAAAIKRFRGAFILTLKGGLVSLDNRLTLEEYVAGVVGREMSASVYPLPALKAQAVAARGYALYSLLRAAEQNRTAPLPRDDSFQVYGGIANEHWRVLLALRETRGEVLTYHGRLFRPYYHSTCGGKTADGSILFGEPGIEPFQSVECGACEGGRFARWEASFSPSQVETALRGWLQARGVSLGRIIDAEVSETTGDGRARYVRVRHETGSLEMQAERFRALLGALGGPILRSMAFVIEKRADELILQGRGWGHGVGLCQVGAGKKGEREGYREILRDYYPGSEVEKVY